MTASLAPGHLLVAPQDVPLLAFLLDEGARAVGQRRRLPHQVSALLAAAHEAVEAIRASAVASTVTAGSPALGSSSQDMTVQEVAEVIGRSPQRVRQLCAEGTLAARRPGRRALAIDRGSVAAYVIGRAA